MDAWPVRLFSVPASFLIVLLLSGAPALAAPHVDTVAIDLNPLIDEAARSPQQFAVNVRHTVSPTGQGTWTREGSTTTWTYQARIPTAVSMSFHALNIMLPPSAVLTVSGARASFRYKARDVTRNGLWGRPTPGDSLSFSLSVDSSEASRVHLEIESLQAGYRGLGGGVPDHPHYREIKAASASGCAENYSCHITNDNQGPAHATVALIIGDLYQCTGTLINDTRGDGTPYVLTARHCERGQLGGGDPDAAENVSVYWDAVTPCGTPLGSIYESSTITQTGATTALEQQDSWLIRLASPPVATDAFYAGWDATGSSFNGGYTIDHSSGENKQYTAWSGIDILESMSGSTLSIAYDSTFWGVVNGIGSVSPGASGSALFSPDNLIVGSLSLAEVSDSSEYGVCPSNPPPAPASSTVTALFTAMSGVWTSSSDRTSSTAGTTLKSLLDPGATGRMTTNGLNTFPIALSSSQTFLNTGDLLTLTWNVQGAQSCTAWGGAPGDGWEGTRPASGSVQIGNSTGGTVNYSINCLTGEQIGIGNVAITWDYIAPLTNLTGGSSGPLMLGATAGFNWDANVGPCVATGGATGDGWAGPQPISGFLSFTVTKAGITNYTLTCGTGARTATDSIPIDGVAPQITLVAQAIEVRVGSSFQLNWFGNGTGGACSASGGSSSDNWALFNANIVPNGSTQLTENVAGTYTYTLTCTGGGQSASSSVTVVVTGAPPAISLAATAPEQEIYPIGASFTPSLDLVWTSDMSGCSIEYTPNGSTGLGVQILSGGDPIGAVSDVETTPGTVTYTMRCGGATPLTASTTINWIATKSTLNSLVTADPNWAANVAYPISWNAGSGPCTGSGGGPGDNWAGPKATSGTQSVSESSPGTYVFSLSCGSGAAPETSQLAVTVPPAFIQVYSTYMVTPGAPYPSQSIVWHSTVGPCTYLDGSEANATDVSVLPTGSATPTPAISGTYLFSVSCGTGANPLYAATFAQITVNAPTTLTASATSAPVDAPVTLTWSASESAVCIATGGDGSAPWVGTLGGSGSGSLIVTSSYVGAVRYGINCGDSTAQTVVNYQAVPATSLAAPTPTVTLTANESTQTEGQSFSLTWNSKNASSCSASGGLPGDGWSGSLATSGTSNVSETQAGTMNYAVTCTGAPPAATASVTVVIKSAPMATTPSGHSGGGGKIDVLLLLALSMGVIVRVRAHRTDGRALS